MDDDRLDALRPKPVHRLAHLVLGERHDEALGIYALVDFEAQVPRDQRLEVAEQCDLLRAALAELTDLTRLVFHLRAAEELSFREIAELAGTTEQSARWHMCEARKRLLDRLGPND